MQQVVRCLHGCGRPPRKVYQNSDSVDKALELRIGLNSGPVVAGVIGRKKFIYNMWGDTVNTASRMESHGIPGEVQSSESTAVLVQPAFAVKARGAMQIDGKGEMHTFLLDQ